METIGQRLKETRLSMEISIEEAAEDLKLTIEQIEAIEEGNIKEFKDIFSLKYFIRDYSKYLGLDYEEMIDEFNEYLFDYTSRISVSDIKSARDKLKREEELESAKIKSPYTIEPKSKKKVIIIISVILMLLITVIGVYYVIKINNEKEDQISISYIK